MLLLHHFVINMQRTEMANVLLMHEITLSPKVTDHIYVRFFRYLVKKNMIVVPGKYLIIGIWGTEREYRQLTIRC